MELTPFIQSLLSEGKVAVKGSLETFSEEDVRSATAVLKAYYEEDRLDAPCEAPAFSEEAALWALQYLYISMQFAALRNEGEEKIRAWLLPFPGEITASVIYSADLCLRYLPSLLLLAKGMAPGDVLVQELKNTALDWPLSSIGCAIKTADSMPEGTIKALATIKANDCLRRMYADRVIRYKDIDRVDSVRDLVHAVIGEYGSVIWPELERI